MKKKTLVQNCDSSLSNFQLTVLKLKSLCVKMQREVPFCRQNSSSTTPTLFHPCHPEVKHKECHWSWHSLASTSQNCRLTLVAHAFNASAMKLEGYTLFTYSFHNCAAQGFSLCCLQALLYPFGSVSLPKH